MKTFTFIATLTMLLIAPAVSAQGKVSRPTIPSQPSPASIIHNPQVKKNTLTKAQQEVIQNLLSNMVYVEGGAFYMGYPDESKEINVGSFNICRYEVTQYDWEAIMGNNPSFYISKGKDCPVERVSWTDCVKFIQQLNRLSGKRFRLPTEAEWEYAARGGNKSQGYRYSGSNYIKTVAWYNANAGRGPHTVGTKECNELGIYDMSGNVWEWCSDELPEDYRVRRGGCWDSEESSCSVYKRFVTSKNDTRTLIGPRLAL